MSSDPIFVLLVEDSDTDAALTEYRLKKAGYQVTLTRVRDGEECMAYLRDPDMVFPDIIFLDLNMPKMDGREVLGEMMADAEFHRIPVVVMTSSDLSADKERAFALGANGYVVKPGDAPEYERMMRVVDEFWLRVNRFPPRRKKAERTV
jgi:CheY-like chemotaxis protein